MDFEGKTGKDVWDIAIEFVLKMEGVYSNEPFDPGGETKYGISKKAYPNLDIANLTLEQAKDIYKKDYWEVCSCDQLPSKIAIAVFDCSVNQGPVIAKRLLQISLGVSVDGCVGPLTIAAAFKANQENVLVMFLARRAQRYVEIILNNATLKIYALNWMRRLFKLADIVLENDSVIQTPGS